MIDRGLVAQLARRPGQKEERFRHRLSADLEEDEPVGAPPPAAVVVPPPPRPTSASTARARGRRAARGARGAARRNRRVSAFEMPPERLAAWLERWADEHGGDVDRTRPGRVTFTGADGATSRRAAFPAARRSRGDRGVRTRSADRARGARPRGRRPAGPARRLRGGRLPGKRLVASKVGTRTVHGRTAPAVRASGATSAAARASAGPRRRGGRRRRGPARARDDLDAACWAATGSRSPR